MSVTRRTRATRATPDATALLKRSHALMQSLFPPEDNFYLDIDALAAPHIAFFVAERGRRDPRHRGAAPTRAPTAR